MENGQLLYTAHSIWFPLVTDSTNKITLADSTGRQMFATRYSMLENLAETVIPYKYLFTGSQVGNMSLKTFWIVFGVGWGVALLIAAIALLIIFVL